MTQFNHESEEHTSMSTTTEPFYCTPVQEIKVGDFVQLDEGFSCMTGRKTIQKDNFGLFLECRCGNHYLEGQLDYLTQTNYIGFMKVD